MLQSLHIENFRGFQEFDLENLGKINLLVGENNSGKTSLLEAIEIFCYNGHLNIILQLMEYRGEYFWNNNQIQGNREREYVIRHLFYGHEIVEETQFLIRGIDNNNQEELSICVDSHIREITSDWTDREDESDDENENIGTLDLIIKSNQIPLIIEPIIVPLLPNNTISQKSVPRRFKTIHSGFLTKTKRITPLSLDVTDLTQLFDNIVLSPNEKFIIEALQIIEPKIERIASVGKEKYSINSRFYGERGGFVIKFSDQNHPIPIGSLGDGIWRILSIILAMVNLENGVLLVDEIDTGLHFTTLFDMWKVILLTARKLNIQVFATTHNSDCWTSLASLIQKEEIQDNEITIQRIERDRKKAVAFNSKQIVIAAERGIEVR